jgi:hypothetical protein
MQRRDFIKGIVGSAGALPLAARAQQAAMPIIGFLHSGSLEQNGQHLAAYRKGLSDAGFVEGKNAAIEFRWAEGHEDRLPAFAADLVRRRVAVIIALFSTPAALAAKAATATIPIVLTTPADPVALGLIASFQPAGRQRHWFHGHGFRVSCKAAWADAIVGAESRAVLWAHQSHLDVGRALHRGPSSRRREARSRG